MSISHAARATQLASPPVALDPGVIPWATGRLRRKVAGGLNTNSPRDAGMVEWLGNLKERAWKFKQPSSMSRGRVNPRSQACDSAWPSHLMAVLAEGHRIYHVIQTHHPKW